MNSVTSLMSKLQVESAKCERHGAYESTGLPVADSVRWSPCPECHAESEAAAQRIHRQKLNAHGNQVRLERAMEQACIPKRYQFRTLDTYQAKSEAQAKALNSARRFADNFDGILEQGGNLIMAGSPGTGKTHLAIGIAHQIIGNGRTAMFMTAMNAIRRIRETYRKDDATERKVIQAMAEPDLLILDEVGIQLGTDSERMTLFEIINARYEQMRPMILISNLDIQGIKDFLGERSADRLREGGGRAILFDWQSYRMEAES